MQDLSNCYHVTENIKVVASISSNNDGRMDEVKSRIKSLTEIIECIEDRH